MLPGRLGVWPVAGGGQAPPPPGAANLLGDWALEVAQALGPDRVGEPGLSGAALAEAALWALLAFEVQPDAAPYGPWVWPGRGPRELRSFGIALREGGVASVEILLGPPGGRPCGSSLVHEPG
eukprot:1656521-Alexandrium_andersonii.AAC.1